MNEEYNYLEEKKQDLLQEYLIQKANMTQEDNNNYEYDIEDGDSNEIRKESDENGLNACGYYYACDLCDGSDLPCACARATIQYLKEKGVEIDYKNTSKEYLDKILRYED